MATIAQMNQIHLMNKVVTQAAESNVIVVVDELSTSMVDFGSFDATLEVAMDRAGIQLDGRSIMSGLVHTIRFN